MDASIAHEVSSDSFKISYGELGHTTSADDNWLDDLDSSHGDWSPEELIITSERSLNHLHTIAYREGFFEGQKASAQEGFNIGFKESVLVGFSCGFEKGASSALSSLPEKLSEKLTNSVPHCPGRTESMA